MAAFSRRHFIGSTAGSALAAAVLPRAAGAAESAQPAGRLRVQFAPGGHTSPLQMYAMFESALFQDMDTVVLPHPDAFDRVGTPDAPHVIVTNDWITGQWPEKEQQNMRVTSRGAAAWSCCTTRSAATTARPPGLAGSGGART